MDDAPDARSLLLKVPAPGNPAIPELVQPLEIAKRLRLYLSCLKIKVKLMDR
jgi:hypothetical protein